MLFPHLGFSKASCRAMQLPLALCPLSSPRRSPLRSPRRCLPIIAVLHFGRGTAATATSDLTGDLTGPRPPSAGFDHRRPPPETPNRRPQPTTTRDHDQLPASVQCHNTSFGGTCTGYCHKSSATIPVWEECLHGLHMYLMESCQK